jgi:hypothetical protein
MQDENMNIPTILFKIVDDPEVERRVSKMELCELVHEKLGWEDDFKKRVRQRLGPPKALEQKETDEQKRPDEQKRFDVDFRLDLDRKLAEYSFKGAINVEYRPLSIPKEFLELTTESIALQEHVKKGEWQSKLQGIGEKLMEHIFFQDRKFTALFWRTVSEVGGLGNTRIRFIVEKEVYPIALEAIYGPHEQFEEDYWMLHAPIYRTIQESGAWGRPLFHDEDQTKGPLNILIIESPTEGESDIGGLKVPLGRLMNVKAECGFLKNYRSSPEYSRGVRIGEVEVIPRPGDRRPFVDQLRETLERGNRVWNIVHYSGHSYFDPRTMKGYVFFPGGEDERGEPLIKVMDLEILSVWLRTAKPNLVFLSSCHSSEAGFVFALASKNIPAIVGFRWDVRDDMAAEYTRVFYRLLFGGEAHSLDDVFLKSRQQIYSQYRNDPIWAAPILVMQVPST